MLNAPLAVSGAPEIMQITGSAARNLGLMGMGHAVLRLDLASQQRDCGGGIV